MGEIQFVGQGPYDLPTLQSSKVISEDNTVEIRIGLHLLTNPSRQEIVVLRMLKNQAIELADNLLAGAEKVAQWERRQKALK